MKNLRYIPAIDRLQQCEAFLEIEKQSELARSVLTQKLQEVVNDLRESYLRGKQKLDLTKEKELHHYIFTELEAKVFASERKNELQPVINATGVVLHTNLGRARLSNDALDHLVQTAKSYSTLEYNLEAGERGSRHDIVEKYLTQLTGAEAAIVVNNNAAAVYFVLKALAEEKEVIVSRGELVEIGGSFRISEIMELSNAHLVEVGTTNKTKVADYKNAITEETGMILKVHKSNFALVGFTEEVATESLVKLAQEKDIPLYEDLGSGTLFDFKQEKIGQEPTVQEQVKKGIDLISFSGDKLLGGPQAGIIVGKKSYIDRLKQHQLARVLRVDKFTLASLEATLKSYMREQVKEIPTIRDILMPIDSIKEKADKFTASLREQSDHVTYVVKKDFSMVGGGTMPEVKLPTYIVEVTHRHQTSEQIARYLRKLETPIIVRIKNEKIQLDFRTVTEEELELVMKTFEEL